jgi:ubiquinone/menaquinone biosynthesis C-methylase UbiE
MKSRNLDLVNQSFAVQAENFENKNDIFSNVDYLNYTLNEVSPGISDVMLEVAAGTCVNGRAFAPHVSSVVCLDATPAMLEVGKQGASREHLQNMSFVCGTAEELPFPDKSFDIVFSRLAFHHFTDTDAVFSEMERVLKDGGKLVMIDMAAPAEKCRNTRDELERLRDPSHVKNLSITEMQQMYTAHGFKLVKSETAVMPKSLDTWLSLTKTPETLCRDITDRMTADIRGQEQTGFSPYLKNGRIFFDQNWVLNIGISGTGE